MEGMGLVIKQEGWPKHLEGKRGDVWMERPGPMRAGGERLCRTKCSTHYERRTWWKKKVHKEFAHSSESMGNGPSVGADTAQQYQHSRLKRGQILRIRTSSTRSNFCLLVTIISCMSPKYLKPKPNWIPKQCGLMILKCFIFFYHSEEINTSRMFFKPVTLDFSENFRDKESGTQTTFCSQRATFSVAH